MASSSSSSSFSSSSASSSSSSSSSSTANKLTCMQCKSDITNLVNGWPLRDGNLAQLCHRCGYFYEKGIFCETFHRHSAGWLECAICLTKLHCACLASNSKVQFSYGGELCCNVCARKLIRGE